MITPATDLISEFIGNFRRIDEHLYAGAQPQLPEGIQELATKYGIATVIDLQSNDTRQEQDICFNLDLNFIGIPLPGVEIFTDPPEDSMGTIRRTLEEPGNQPVFIHCLHGADRTGAIVGEYRIDHGATVAEALAEMKRYHNSWIELGFRDAVEDYFEKKQKGAT